MIIETLRERMLSGHIGNGALLRKCQGLRLEVGELDSAVFGKVDASLSNAEDAAMVQQAAQGMLALVMLHQDQNNGSTKLLQGIKINLDGSNFSIRAEINSVDILDGAKEKLRSRADK